MYTKSYKVGGLSKYSYLRIWNKIDLVEPENEKASKTLLKDKRKMAISATTNEGISTLIKEIKSKIELQKFSEALIIPFEFGDRKAWLHENGVVVNELYTDVGFKIEVMWSHQQKAKYYSFAS